ncbi:hypothetical protein DPMN_075065 [Dreissena polymorpha]|uniref:Uncharacterized protein n=1 Tax=Dreissena polymorpha TaxID=45954 RepID=A0A9D4BP16_DREPO|nr:hypothetical protein DPMN_075065 [Dreissena polymorpha]
MRACVRVSGCAGVRVCAKANNLYSSHYAYTTFQNFQANTGVSSDLVTNVLPCPVAALCVRVNPRSWFIHISMQFDVKGCLTSDVL